MFDKLELHHVVRYFFSGTVLLVGALMATGVSSSDLVVWLAANPWIRDGGSVTAILILIFLSGFLSFTVYRGFIYEIGIISIKTLAGRLFRHYSYRDYICDLLTAESHQSISRLKAERLYALLKVTRLKDFYQITASPITTSLHFLYFSTLVAIGCALFDPVRLFPLLLVGLGAFALFVYMDWHFEELELLVFKDQSEVVRSTLRDLAEKGLLGPTQNTSDQQATTTDSDGHV